MLCSHNSPQKPSPLVALICLTIVRRLCPQWVAVSTREAARAEGQNPERISRLATRVLGGLESLVATLTRIGRGRNSGHSQDSDARDSELAMTRALLEVATSLLSQTKRKKGAGRVLLAGAYRRLVREYPQLTQKRFCEALALPIRTLRSWLKTKPKPEKKKKKTPPTNDAKPAPRPADVSPRRPRFGFDVTVPGTQIAADTTNLRVFGVPLKLIASQDVGGRDQSLLESIIVDERESADLVVEVLTEALAEQPGAQCITDQGTPYLAEKTRDALEELEAEHAVQKEGDPCGKATLERAFGSIKQIAAPLLEATNRIATKIAGLSRPDVAITSARLLIIVLLRAYQAGARASQRACHQRPADPDVLTRIAEQSRERARADRRSARLVLAHIHGAYGIDCPLTDFVRRFRSLPISVLYAAERAFARQAHRTDINNRTAYFARLVRLAHDDYRKHQARDWRERQDNERRREHQRRVQAERDAWHANPASWLRDSLDLIAEQWTGTTLLVDGAGVSTWLRQSLARLTELHGPLAADVAATVVRDFGQAHLPVIGPAGVSAVAAVFRRHLETLPTTKPTTSCTAQFVAMLRGTGSTPRPPPSTSPC